MKKVKIIAFVSAVIVGLLIYFFFSSLDQYDDSNRLSVVTAAVDISSNIPITEEMVTLTKLPMDAVLSGSFSDKKLVYGKVSRTDLFAGEQILKGKLVSAGDNKSGALAYTIQPGQRAITIAADNTTGLAGMLKPQDKVDIISDFDRETSDGGTVSYTTLIAENVTILSLDSVLSKEGKETTGEETFPYSTITLQVTPQQAMELSMSEYKGHLRAILRSPLDEKKTNLPSITLDSVMVN